MNVYMYINITKLYSYTTTVIYMKCGKKYNYFRILRTDFSQGLVKDVQ